MVQISMPSDSQTSRSRRFAGGVDDLAVEGDAVPHHVRALRRGQAFDVLLQGLHPVSQMRGGELGRGLLQTRAHREELREVDLGELPDARAAVGHRLDQPQRLQLPQRLADRRLTDPQFGGDATLDDTLAGLEFPRRDAVDEDLPDLVSEAGADQGRCVESVHARQS